MPQETYESFFARLKDKLSQEDIFDIDDAYRMAKAAHQYDFRKELDPETDKPLRVFEHPKRAAIILMDIVNCFTPNLIIAMLLHDTVEDTRSVSNARIKHRFGREVADLNRLMTKTTEDEDTYIDDLMQYGDWRVWLLKCCDRLDNLRSLPLDDREFCDKQIYETRTKYFPMLSRLLETCPQYLLDGVGRLNREIKVLG